MKFPVAPIQRAALGVATCAFMAASVSAVALITQPASTSAESATTEMTFVEPVAEEETTTTTAEPTVTTTAEETPSMAERAEKAAGRAEVAAGRAEVAAVQAETATTTTTAPTTTTTTVGRPILVDVTEPTIATTTTTAVPKKWEVVARIPLVGSRSNGQEPTTTDVTFKTGQIRVLGLPNQASMLNGFEMTAVWLADDNPSTISDCAIVRGGQEPVHSAAYEGGDCWPTGQHTVAAGSLTRPSGSGDNYKPGQWVAPFGARTNDAAEIVIEEYR